MSMSYSAQALREAGFTPVAMLRLEFDTSEMIPCNQLQKPETEQEAMARWYDHMEELFLNNDKGVSDELCKRAEKL